MKFTVCKGCGTVIEITGMKRKACKCGEEYVKQLSTRHPMKQDNDNIRVGYGSHRSDK